MAILREAKGGRMNFCEFGARLIYIASSKSGRGYILRLCLKRILSIADTFSACSAAEGKSLRCPSLASPSEGGDEALACYRCVTVSSYITLPSSSTPSHLSVCQTWAALHRTCSRTCTALHCTAPHPEVHFLPPPDLQNNYLKI